MRPPYFTLTAVCRNDRCSNHGKEFSRDKKKLTYISTAGTEEPIGNLTCPECRSWGRVIRWEKMLPIKEAR